MGEEITYALITPYSLHKSRTGGIISRLLVFSNLDFIGARMYTPSDAFVDEYVQTYREADMEEKARKIFIDYIENNFRKKNRLGISNRTMLLLFKGPDAVNKLRKDVIGPITYTPTGDTIRGTYGDFQTDKNGNGIYFEPAVLTASDSETNNKQLAIFAKYADSDGGILEDVIKFPEGSAPETTLVILKPDNFARGSSSPGNMIDIFSKTGLFIVGAKMLRMSVAEAEEFYAPLKGIFEEKLKSNVAMHLKEHLKDTLEFEVSDESYKRMAEILKKENARHEFNRIVEYMSGVNPETASDEQRRKPGRAPSLALLYQGIDAVSKIRQRLGSTDPSAAEPGTVRSAFGKDLMRNGAHASDSPESAERERKTIDFLENKPDCDIKIIIEKYLENK